MYNKIFCILPAIALKCAIEAEVCRSCMTQLAYVKNISTRRKFMLLPRIYRERKESGFRKEQS